MKTQQAIMLVSRAILLHLLPAGKTIDCVADKLGVAYEWLAEALKLPSGTKITGVSISVRFSTDEVALRIESPDFIETPVCGMLPEVYANYQHEGNSFVFNGWSGPAVSGYLEVREAAKPVRFREFL